MPRRRLDAFFSKARGRDTLKAAGKLTPVVEGSLVFNEDPPVVQRIEMPDGARALNQFSMAIGQRCLKHCASSSSAIASPTSHSRSLAWVASEHVAS